MQQDVSDGRASAGPQPPSLTAEAAVVGAGPAGLVATLALASLGIDVVCIGPPFAPDPSKPDTRTTALFDGSVQLLRNIGVWEDCKDVAAPLKCIRIIDDTSAVLRAPDVEFHAGELGLEAFGFNVPNKELVAALHARLSAHPNARYQESAGIIEILPVDDAVYLRTAEGEILRFSLVGGADGRHSICRTAADIETVNWQYDQSAIACNLDHEASHDYVSTEFHGPGGPCTVVPLPGRASSLVWVDRPDLNAERMSLSEPDFAALIQSRLHGVLGAVTGVGPRASFPLAGLSAKIFGAKRIALLGEAAHVVPPIGAQGLNLGFRDAAALADCVAAVQRAGGDIGSEAVLTAYSDQRKGDVWSRTAAIDLLNRSLLSGMIPAQGARGLGLFMLGKIGPLRRFVMRQGLQPSGPRPSLMT